GSAGEGWLSLAGCGYLERRLALDPNLLDARPLDRLDPQLGVAQLERGANLRGGAELVEDIAADGVVVIAANIEFQELIDVVHADPAVEHDFVGIDELDFVLFTDVVLVLDRTDDLLENVLDRDG